MHPTSLTMQVGLPAPQDSVTLATSLPPCSPLPPSLPAHTRTTRKPLAARLSKSRPNIFDLEIRRPELLYKTVVEVCERVVLDKENEGGWEELAAERDGDEDGHNTVIAAAPSTGGKKGAGNAWSGSTIKSGSRKRKMLSSEGVVVGLTGEGVRVVQEPDMVAVRSSLQGVLDQGITSLAIVLLHRYREYYS